MFAHDAMKNPFHVFKHRSCEQNLLEPAVLYDFLFLAVLIDIMTENWADAQRMAKFCSTRLEEQKPYPLSKTFSTKPLLPSQQPIASRLSMILFSSKGKKISFWLFSLLFSAIIYPTTTSENHKRIVEILIHISKVPNVIVDDKPLKERTDLLATHSRTPFLVCRMRFE